MNNYSLHHKEKGQSLFTKTFVVILLTIGILITVHIFFPKVFSDTAHFISTPFWKAKNLTIEALINSAQLLHSKKMLVSKNNDLKAQIKLNSLKLLGLNLFKRENIHLKELFNRQISSTEGSILGVILARPSVSMYDTFVIDIGSESGVKKDNYVFVEGDIFIGRIDEVHKDTSLVRLFSSPGETTQISIGPQGLPASAEGIGGGNFIVKLPRDAPVEKGDIVTMPDISARIFAIVEEVESNPSDPFLTVLFKNPVNMNEIKWVQIITREKVVPQGGALRR